MAIPARIRILGVEAPITANQHDLSSLRAVLWSGVRAGHVPEPALINLYAQILLEYRKNFCDSPSREEVVSYSKNFGYSPSRLGCKSRDSETKFLEMDEYFPNMV